MIVMVVAEGGMEEEEEEEGWSKIRRIRIKRRSGKSFA